MSNISESNPMPASAILSIIAGALMLAGGALALSFWNFWNQAGFPGWGSMMGGNDLMGDFGTMHGGTFGWAIGIASGLSLATGAIVLAGGYFIYRKPETRIAWGTGILVASIIGLFGMGGFIIGPILGIVGGILALTKK